jgi:putative hydrolase of the HAD superfamily
VTEPARLALFDLDNTLADRDGAFEAWARERAAAWQPADPDGALAAIRELDGDGLRPRPAFVADLRARFALAETAEELHAGFVAGCTARILLEPGAAEALATLRGAGYRLAIVTNGGPTQHVKLDACGLRPLVDACVLSDEVGVHKPDPAIFTLAAAAAGATLAGAWMVGDRADADVGGAVAAGIASVWLHRGRRWPDDLPFAPTAIAGSLREAVREILARAG